MPTDRPILGQLVRSPDRGARMLALLLCVIFAGCDESKPSPAAPSFQGTTLSVGALGDAAILDAVRVQGPEWESQTGANLSISPKPIELDDAAAVSVLVFPGNLLGELIDRGALAIIRESAVRPVDTEAPLRDDDPELDPSEFQRRRDPLDFNDIAQPYREQVTKYGDDRIALPLGGTALVLVTRRDAFRAPANIAAAKDAGVALEPPAMWTDLDALARFFNGRDWAGDGVARHGIALALAPDPSHLAQEILLARAAALGQPLDQFALLFDGETGAARLAQPPFVEALDGIAALAARGPPDAAELDPQDARAAFREGRAAMLIDRAEFAHTWTDPKNPVAVDVSALPASSRVFDPARAVWLEPSAPNRVAYLPGGGGWLVGIGSQAKGPTYDAAISFLQAIASPEVAQAIVSDPAFPMTPTRTSHLALGLPDPRSALGVDTRAWGKAVADSFAAPRAVVGLRIPDAAGYLDDLAAALRSAVREKQPAQAALDSAAAAWDARSAKLGKARQLWHYRRSVNRLSTTTTPPPREPAR